MTISQVSKLLAASALASGVVLADESMTEDAINARLAPVGHVSVVGSAAPAAEAAPASTPVPAEAAAPAVAEAAPAPAAAPSGESTYKATCFACHDFAVAGAPKFGDKAAWAPRIAQGKETLYDHALHGFNGQSGVMPAKGGNAGLSDDAVKAAVDHMISAAE